MRSARTPIPAARCRSQDQPSAIVARPVALAGFGPDSLTEVGASAVVIWELSALVAPPTGRESQKESASAAGHAGASGGNGRRPASCANPASTIGRMSSDTFAPACRAVLARPPMQRAHPGPGRIDAAVASGAALVIGARSRDAGWTW